ncbi:hypothetical protein [Sphingomonas koreensis]
MALAPDWRERRDRGARRAVILFTGIFLLWVAAMFLTAINDRLSPVMPEIGRNRIWAALPLSYRLLDGGWWEWLLFAGLWAPPVGVPLFFVVMAWRRPARERAHRRIRDRERRARKRAEREAAKVPPAA